MSNVAIHILNADGSLDKQVKMIDGEFKKASRLAQELLGLKQVDVVVRDEPCAAIPELHVGGWTRNDGHHIYIALDSQKDIRREDLLSTFLHEFHHAARFQKTGWGKTLGDQFVNEGLACLFEEETTGNIPIYSKVKINKDQILKAQKAINSRHFSHDEWFFGSKEIPRWFGYTFGYQLVRSFSDQHGKPASDLVSLSSKKVLSN
jgi:uncharacterized protein YjaZ